MILLNIYLPNFWNRGIFYYKNITCNQKVIVNGKGIVEVENNTTFGFKLGGKFKYGYVELQARSSNSIIKIGRDVSINNNLFICAENQISIGDNTLIGQNVTIIDFDGHGISPDQRNSIGEIGTVHISKNVWIGNNVLILKNTFIGENTVIAAGSIVSGSHPSNVVIAGIPAKVIKNI